MTAGPRGASHPDVVVHHVSADAAVVADTGLSADVRAEKFADSGEHVVAGCPIRGVEPEDVAEPVAGNGAHVSEVGDDALLFERGLSVDSLDGRDWGEDASLDRPGSHDLSDTFGDIRGEAQCRGVSHLDIRRVALDMICRFDVVGGEVLGLNFLSDFRPRSHFVARLVDTRCVLDRGDRFGGVEQVVDGVDDGESGISIYRSTSNSKR